MKTTAVACAAVVLSCFTSYFLDDAHSASFAALFAGFVAYLVVSLGAFCLLVDGPVAGLVSVIAALVGGTAGFAMNADRDGDFDIDRQEMAFVSSQVHKELDLDQDGEAELYEGIIARSRRITGACP